MAIAKKGPRHWLPRLSLQVFAALRPYGLCLKLRQSGVVVPDISPSLVVCLVTAGVQKRLALAWATLGCHLPAESLSRSHKLLLKCMYLLVYMYTHHYILHIHRLQKTSTNERSRQNHPPFFEVVVTTLFLLGRYVICHNMIIRVLLAPFTAKISVHSLCLWYARLGEAVYCRRK